MSVIQRRRLGHASSKELVTLTSSERVSRGRPSARPPGPTSPPSSRGPGRRPSTSGRARGPKRRSARASASRSGGAGGCRARRRSRSNPGSRAGPAPGPEPAEPLRTWPSGVAAEVADCPVERREQPLVGRREGDDVPAGAEVPGGPGDLGGVVLDVLEHVHVEDRVEGLRLVEPLERADPDLATARERAGADLVHEPAGEGRVGLQADPSTLDPPAEDAGRPAQPGADLQDVHAQIRGELVAEVRLPVPRRREQVELGTDVGIGGRHR